MSKVRFALTTSALVLLPLVVAFAPVADRVAFGPEDDSEATREFSLQLALYLDDLRIVADGQEVPVPVEGLDSGILIDVAVEVLDRFVRSDEGRVVELVRNYEQITGTAGPEGETESMDGVDELVDKPIRFLWDAEEDGYKVSFADEEARGEDDLIDGLLPDMDFTMLLPEAEVSKGDTWSVRGKELALLFLPGGIPTPTDDDGEDADIKQLVEDALEAQLGESFRDFEVTCVYQGTRAEGDSQVGEIAFDYQGKAAIDLTELIQSIVAARASEMGDVQMEVVANLSLEFDGSGILLWDMAAGRSHSMDMTSEVVVMFEAEADVDAMGQQVSAEFSAEVSGNGKWNAVTR